MSENSNKAASPFEYVNAISMKDPSVADEDRFRGYMPFIINRAFGNFYETVLLANEMNGVASELPNSLQYSFLYNSVRQGKRWFKWDKPDPNMTKKITSIMKYYSVSRKVAEEYFKTLSSDAVDDIVEYIDVKEGVL